MSSKLSYIYTIICTLSPIFILYSFAGSFTFVDNLIILFYICGIPYIVKRGFKVATPFLILFLFLLIHSIFIYLQNDDLKMFLRAMHLANYYLFISLFGRSFFNYSLGKKILRYFSIIATFYLILQHAIKYLTGVSIPGILPFFSIAEADLELGIIDANVFRFSSFFVEPASYAEYIICAIILELFYSERLNMKILSFLCLGGIMSTSNTALAGIGFALGIYLLKNGLFNKKIFVLLFVFFVIYIVAQPFVEANLVRIDNGGSYNGRMDGYSKVLKVLNNPLTGIGFVSLLDLDFYLPGFPRLLLYVGFSGLALFLFEYINIFRCSSQKILVTLFLVLNFGTGAILGIGFLYYNCFIANSLYPKRKMPC